MVLLFIAISLIGCYISMALANPMELSPFMVSGLLLLISINQAIENGSITEKTKFIVNEPSTAPHFYRLFFNMIDQGGF